jgi:glycosyltransferase involved in cell wall biosynthesis
MKIAFIHNHRAFLPELPAYQSFFQSKNIETCIAQYGEEEKSGADVYWYMMGFYMKAFHKKKLIIHEYSSASVPPYRKLKDFLKSRLSPRPDFRLYLNEYVRGQINIHDGVPFGYRDMGVSDTFLYETENIAKEFDFIYSGNLSAQRKLDILLKPFDQGALKQHSIILLGHDEQNLAKTFRHCDNIFFQSAVPWEEVPGWLSKARYCVNFIPDLEPFNAQTPTKFLEYAAMKIPVISTNYFWISEFQERYGGNYFLLKEDLSNMTWDRITRFPYEFPDLHSWRWEERIQSSGILEFLLQANNRRQLTIDN